MKLRNFLLLLLGLVSSLAFSGCKDDEASDDKLSSALQQYKWVCEYSDHSVEIGLSDYYTITLYFVNDSECLVRNYHKRYDADSSPHYSSEEECETIQYTVNGDQITFSKSKFIQYNEAYSYIVSAIYWHDFLYEKQAITSSDQSYISEHYTPKPTPSPEGMSFMGLKAVGSIGNFQCDNMGRLIAYSTSDSKVTYEYSNNKIVKKQIYSSGNYDQSVYKLTNGLITSVSIYTGSGSTLYEDYKIKYKNNQIVQITKNGYVHFIGETIYDFKWNNSGNIIEVLFDSENFCTIDYLNSISSGFEYMGNHSVYPGLVMDDFLLLQSYFGNSIPKNNIKTIRFKTTLTEYYTYTHDSKGRIEEVNERSELYNGSESYHTTYYVWE